MWDVPFTIILLILIAPFCLAFHEIGHVYGAKLVRANHIELAIGAGKQIWQTTFKGIKVRVGLLLLVNSHTISSRKRPYTTNEQMLVSIMGPLFSLCLAMLLFIIYSYLVDLAVVYVLHLFNLWIGLVNLIPFKIGQKESDGYTICRQLHQKNKVT